MKGFLALNKWLGFLCLAMLVSCGAALAQAVVPTPVVVVPAPGVIDYGQAFGWLQPYVIAVASSLISAAFGWILLAVNKFLGLKIDKQLSDAYITNAQNQAASLIAKGFVVIRENGKVDISNAALASAANDLISKVPDAAARFDLKPGEVAEKITAMVPQVPAVAPVIAEALPAGRATK